MTELFSITDDTDDIGIFNFNLNADELNEMYKQPAHDDYSIVVALFYADDTGAANARGLLDALLAEQRITSIPRFELTGDRKTYFCLQELPLHLDGIMSPAQQAWWFDGVYVQCGFWRTSMANDESLLRGISTAMMWHDARVKAFSDHRAIDPTPLAFEAHDDNDQTPAVLARNFRFVVNDIFREGAGIWCGDLVEPRNEILIKVRARLAGDDPQAEWEQFKASGMNYFLNRHLIAR